MIHDANRVRVRLTSDGIGGLTTLQMSGQMLKIDSSSTPSIILGPTRDAVRDTMLYAVDSATGNPVQLVVYNGALLVQAA